MKFPCFISSIANKVKLEIGFENDLKRQKEKGNKTLISQTLVNIAPEDVFSWVREGFKNV